MESTKSKKVGSKLPKTIHNEMDKYKLCEKTYLQTIVENNEKQEKKIRGRLQDDIKKQ